MKHLSFLVLFIFCLEAVSFCQSKKSQLAKLIDTELAKGVPVKEQNPLKRTETHTLINQKLIKQISKYSLYELDASQLKEMQLNADALLKFPVSIDNNTTVHLILKPVNIFSDDFKAMTDKGPLQYKKGGYFRGIVQEWENSTAAISVFEDNIAGFFSSGTNGFYSITRVQQPAASKAAYIAVYNEANVLNKEVFSCKTKMDSTKDVNYRSNLGSREVSGLTTKTIRIHYEANHFTNSNFPNAQFNSTFDAISSLGNQVQTEFQDEEIRSCVSSIFIWTIPDPIYYPFDPSYQGIQMSLYNLNSYRESTGINGDLGVYLSSHLNLGGIATMGGAINCSKSSNMCIVRYNADPGGNFWTLYNTMHETGHLLGSLHSNSCSWNGGPIENCGGTVNSGNDYVYCPLDQANYTGNISTGYTGIKSWMNPTGITPTAICAPGTDSYGTFIRDFLKEKVDGCPCFGTECLSNPAGCIEPSQLSVTNHTMGGVTFNWPAVTGAASYTLEYYTNISTIVPINVLAPVPPVAVISHTVSSGMQYPNIYYWRVKTNCSTGTSPFHYGPAFQLPVTACAAPGNLTASCITGTSVNLGWTSAASSFILEYKLSTALAWTPVGTGVATIVGNTVTINNLLPSTAYDWRVRSTNCSSAFSNSQFTTSASGCGAAENLGVTNLTDASVRLNWQSVANASSYLVQVSTTPSFTTFAFNNTTSNTFENVSGLLYSTTYYWRVKANCGCYSAIRSFTTKCPTPQNLTAIQVTSNSAKLTWTATPNIYYYLDVSTASNFSSFVYSGLLLLSTDLPYQLFNLNPVTTYYWRVTTSCGDMNNSGVFTTAPNVPVFLTGFSATPECANARVRLNWTTQNEANSSHFVIERSTDGLNYMWVKQVPAAGNSSVPLPYEYFDNYPIKGFATYRLIIVDLNGSYTISPVVTIQANAAKCFTGVQPPAIACNATIAGPERLCYNNTSYTYSIGNIPDYTFVNWGVTPQSQTLVNSTRHYSNKFELVRNSGEGAIALSATLSRCTNSTLIREVAVGPIAMPAVSIQGNDLFCNNSQFSVQNLPVGSTVLWSSSNPNIATISSTGLASGVNNGTCTISATITAPTNTCYAVTTITKNITIGNPAAISISIMPPNADLCTGIPFMAESYLEGATSYTWQAPTGLQFNSANGLSYINAQVVSPPLGGPLTLIALNRCGSVTGSHVLIPQPQFPPPGKNQPYITMISGSCIANSFTAQVVAVPNAVSYYWKVRELDVNGNLLAASPWFMSSTNQGTYSLTNLLTRSAVVYVYAVTNCGITPTINASFNTCRLRARTIPYVQEQPVKVVPNPTSGICKVYLPAELLVNSNFTLRTTKGEDIKKGKVSGVKGFFQIDLTKYPGGVYTLVIENDKMIRHVQIVKN